MWKRSQQKMLLFKCYKLPQYFELGYKLFIYKICHNENALVVIVCLFQYSKLRYSTVSWSKMQWYFKCAIRMLVSRRRASTGACLYSLLERWCP